MLKVFPLPLRLLKGAKDNPPELQDATHANDVDNHCGDLGPVNGGLWGLYTPDKTEGKEGYKEALWSRGMFIVLRVSLRRHCRASG